MEGNKFDDGKPMLDLLPPIYWEQVAFSHHSAKMALWAYYYANDTPPLDLLSQYDATPVFEFGAKKYGYLNWFRGIRLSRLVAAFHRHANDRRVNGTWVAANLDREDRDSGLPRGAHCAWYQSVIAEFMTGRRLMEERLLDLPAMVMSPNKPEI